ncbi:fibronectin type III domain-containing protein [Arenibacter sp. 6A1]|nr:fibronectin type III domain-containing protein [Arenibacter sp. 6A1]
MTLSVFLLYSSLVHGQSFPVQVLPQTMPPIPVHFSEYADMFTTNGPLRVQLVLNDLNISDREVRLKIYFEGNGIRFRSKDFISGAKPLYLEGGMPLVLSQSDLAPYFSYENIMGISPHTYGQTIPEGVYQFCFEVIDVLTGNSLSRKTCTRAVVFKNEPPFLISPRNKTDITEVNPQNIVFQWTPRHINVSQVEYEFSLVEIWDHGIDPQAAFLSTPPIFQTTTTASTYIYGPADPMLMSDKKYAWRVQAKAKKGAEEIGLFTNQGYSEIFSFSYAGSCNLPMGIAHEVKGSTNANIFWEDFSTDIPEYTVRYRQKGKANEWFLGKTTANRLTLWDLKAGTTYEYQLQKKCTVTGSEWSTTKELTTLIVDTQASIYECGIAPNFKLTNKDPLPKLISDDIFMAGDFPVTVTEVNGSEGRFTGKGYVTIPYLNSIKVAVAFTNVLVNTDKQLVEGTVITKYDPVMKNILDVDVVAETIDTVSDLVAEPFEGNNDLDEMRINFAIPKDSIDNYITIKDGMVTITNPVNGASISEPLGDDKVVIDGAGQVYHIDAEGKITQGGQIDTGGAVTANNVEGISKDGQLERLTAKDIQISFKEVPGIYGFDQIPMNAAYNTTLQKEYTNIEDAEGKEYILVHQAVENQGETYIDAVITQTGKNPYPLDSIVFKTSQGEKLEWSILDPNTLRLKVKGHYTFEHETIYAVVPSRTDSSKQLTAGAFMLWHLTDRAVDVVLVSVNGATIPDPIATEVHSIFKKGVTSVNVSISKENITLDPSILGDNQQLDIGESSWLTNYNEEQKAIISHLKSQLDYDKNTYYLFVFGDDVQPTKAIGGFMPLLRQYGFVFKNANGGSAQGMGGLAKTIAHEIGHGVFALRHPIELYGMDIEGKTKWLMDYQDGSLLSHMDWKQLHNPKLKFYVFQDNQEGEYETDGHYSTVYLTSLMLGMENKKAKNLARYAEYPDTDIHDDTAKLRYTWAHGEQQIITHALNNGFHSDIELLTALEFINASDKDIVNLGRLLHKYGDTYSHSKVEYFDDFGNPTTIIDSIKMYGKPITGFREKIVAKLSEIYFGHKLHTCEHKFPDGLTPDLIAKRPNWYIKYVRNLAMIISLKFNLDKNLNYKFQNENIKLFEELSLYAQQHNISLIGIMNYETAKWLYNNSNKNEEYFSFYVPFARGKLAVQNREAHEKHIKNTKRYLKDKNIKFTTRSNIGKPFDDAIYITYPPVVSYKGTEFKIWRN